MSAFHITSKMIAMEAAHLLSKRLPRDLAEISSNTWAGMLACAGSDALLLTIKHDGGTVEQEIERDDLLLSLDDFSSRFVTPSVYALLVRLSHSPANEDR